MSLDGCVCMGGGMPMADKPHRIVIAWVCMGVGMPMADKHHRYAVGWVGVHGCGHAYG
jgi:hypothetical protein